MLQRTSAMTAPAASGLSDLGDALEVVVEKGGTSHTFQSIDLTLTIIADGKHLKVDTGTLNTLSDGAWTIRLTDVRDEIGNYYDADPATPGVQHDEWNIELY